MSAELISVTMGSGACEVLELDDSKAQEEYRIEVRYGRRYMIVTGDRAALLSLQQRFQDRTLSGWDQPLWYARSASAAAKKIRAALAASQGGAE